jgi:uncharacterized protein YegJ (DUF2314 family)
VSVRVLLITIALATVVFTGPPAAAQDSDTFIKPSKDAPMLAAVDSARASLPSFWRHLESPDRRDEFSLEVTVPSPQRRVKDRIWVKDVTRDHAGVIRGVVLDDPGDAVGVKQGDTLTVDPTSISDWGYRLGGHRYGFFTMRVLLAAMPPEKAASYNLNLAPTPLEPGDR